MKLRFVFLAASTLAAAAAQAATLTYGVSAGAGHSDNIARAATNEQSETMASAGLDFSLAEETAKLRALIGADFSYVDYQDNTFDSEVIGNLNAQAVFGLLPERLEWFAQDNFGQVRSDPFQPVNPANRENINYLTTGPDLTLRLGSSTRGKLSGRYSKVTYEDSPLDSDRLGGTLSFLQNLSPATVLSANVPADKIEYDDSSVAASDYDRQEAFLGYTATLSRMRANVELGYSILSRDTAPEDNKGLVARLEVQRELSSRSTISFRAGREFSDSGSSFRLQQDMVPVGLDTQAVLQTADPFTSKYASLGWSLSGRRTGFGVDASVFEESYEQQTALDRRRTLAGAYASRNLTPSLQFQLRGSFAKEAFDNVVNSDFHETTLSASLNWQAGRKIGFNLQYDHAERSADTALTQYQENRVWLQIRYGEGKRGAALQSASRSRSTPTPAGE